ncbi:hypothetical protein CDCA_CDCA07G2016 [Cyanidium caldarium]|uniref:UDP-glucose:glycoprotein glucosyltransferase n=1 Tax=Cyanidium caldarium TaxID=2771 RepID=A0AAV9IVA8_CYACA|nr:hypothetical protein CDCA_CDCA07G2016 [Cyanidium caldarium]
MHRLRILGALLFLAVLWATWLQAIGAQALSRPRSGKQLAVRVVASWPRTPLHLEAVEWVGEWLSEWGFWALADAAATAGGDGRGDDAEAGRYRWVLDRVTHILRERDDRRDMPSWRWLLATLNGTVAHRVYSPRVALHAQLAAEDWMRVRGGGDDDDDVQPEDAWALVVCGDGAFAVDAGALASISDDWTAVCADRGHRSGDRRPEQHTLHGEQRRRIILSLDHVRSNQSTWSPFAESHHNAEHAGPTATVVLYADLLRDCDFSAMHRQLTHAAAASHVVYVLRHRVPLAAASGTPTTPPLSLAGYSVEVAIKSTDYIALDDESLGEHPGTAAAHTTTVTEASTEKVLEDVADLNRTEVDERLGVVALQSVVGALSNVGHSVSSRHPSIDPLTYVEQLSGDLPSLAPLILRAHAGPRTGVPMAAPESLEEALLSLEAHLQELGAGVSVSSLPSALFINGRPVASSAPRMLQCASAVYAAATAVESAGMIDASGRRASATTPDLHALMFQLPPAAAPDQHGAYTESVSMRLRLADDAPSANTTLLDRQRCDLHAVLVHLNDIERNRKYQHWNDSYRGLLSSSDPHHHHHHDNDSAAAHLPQVRRNLFRVRALVDPASAVGLDMLVQLLDLVQSTRPLLPLQVSVVLVPRWNASEVACGECAAVAQSASSDTRIPETLGRTDSVSVAVTRAFFYLLHEHDSLRDAVSFVRAVHWQAQREHPYAQVALMLGSVAALPPMPPQLHHVRAAFTIQYRRAHSVDEATAKRAFERICLQGISPVSFATSSPSPSSTSPVLACEPALCGHRVYRALNLPLDAPSMVFFNGLLMSDGTVVHGGDHDVGTMLLREWRRLAAQVRAGRLPDEMSSEEAIFGKDVSTDGQMMTAPTILRMSAYEPQLLRPERGTTAGPGDVVAGASRALPHWLAGGHGSHAKSKRIAYLGNAAYHAMPASTAPNVRNVVTVWLFEDWQRRDGWQSLAWMLRALQQLDNATDTHPVAVRLALFPTDGRATAALAELMHRYADSAVATCPTAALSALETYVLERLRDSSRTDTTGTPADALHLPQWSWDAARAWYAQCGIGGIGDSKVMVNGRAYTMPRTAPSSSTAVHILESILRYEAHRALPMALRLEPLIPALRIPRDDALALALSVPVLLDSECQTPSRIAPLPYAIVRALLDRQPALHYDSRIATSAPAHHAPGAYLTVEGVVAPLTRSDARVLPVLRQLLRDALGARVRLLFTPRSDTVNVDGRPAPPTYVRTRVATDPLAATSATDAVRFEALPERRILTVSLVPLRGWLAVPSAADRDLDNLLLARLPDGATVSAEYRVEHTLVEGHAVDVSARRHPRGLKLVLEAGMHGGRTSGNSSADTVVMDNLGYFQLPAAPGVWRLRFATRTAQHFFGPRPHVAALAPGDADSLVVVNRSMRDEGGGATVGEYAAEHRLIVDGLSGVKALLHLRRAPGMERMRFRESEHEGEAASMSATAAAPSTVQRLRALLPCRRITTTTLPRSTDERIHIFSVASGHLYERFLRIMMLSAVRATPTRRLKFWLLANFLSPAFQQQLQRLSRRLGFDYQLVTYPWPAWLRPQTDKQRLIWAYKLLFLDVLFPVSLHRVLFIDSDQVVRGDLAELWDTDMGPDAVYGFVPFCDSRPEVDGFRFWKSGFWQSHLRGRPYHISALFLVDLARFRNTGAGDTLRALYQHLSADPQSLANLDQDLPNYASVPLPEWSRGMSRTPDDALKPLVPLYSLPREWLWCESWCSDTDKPRAKTIDLCNNPMTREPKLQSAPRIIPEWRALDADATAAATWERDDQWEAYEQRWKNENRSGGIENDTARHDEL